MPRNSAGFGNCYFYRNTNPADPLMTMTGDANLTGNEFTSDMDNPTNHKCDTQAHQDLPDSTVQNWSIGAFAGVFEL